MEAKAKAEADNLRRRTVLDICHKDAKDRLVVVTAALGAKCKAAEEDVAWGHAPEYIAAEKKRKAAEEKHKEEEKKRRKAEKEAKEKAEEEVAEFDKQLAARGMKKMAAEKAAEEAQHKAEEEAQRKAEEEAQRKAAEEAPRMAEKEKKRKARDSLIMSLKLLKEFAGPYSIDACLALPDITDLGVQHITSVPNVAFSRQ